MSLVTSFNLIISVCFCLHSDSIVSDARLLGNDEARHLAPVDRNSAVTCHAALQKLLEPLVRQQRENANTLTALAEHVRRVEAVVQGSLGDSRSNWWNLSARDFVIIVFAILVQAAVLHWLRQ